MKSHPSNGDQISFQVIDIRSLSSERRRDIGKFFTALSAPVVVVHGKRKFLLSEVTLGKVQGRALPDEPADESSKVPDKIGRIEVRELYNKYRPFYEAKYVEKKKQTEEYGAKTYAAKETVKEIFEKEGVIKTKRQILDAMKGRTGKKNDKVRDNDTLK